MYECVENDGIQHKYTLSSLSDYARIVLLSQYCKIDIVIEDAMDVNSEIG